MKTKINLDNLTKLKIDDLTIDESGKYICYDLKELDVALSKFLLNEFDIDSELSDEVQIRLSISDSLYDDNENWKLFGKTLYNKIIQNLTKYINFTYKAMEDKSKNSPWYVDRNEFGKIYRWATEEEMKINPFNSKSNNHNNNSIIFFTYIQQNTDGKKIRFMFELNIAQKDIIQVSFLQHEKHSPSRFSQIDFKFAHGIVKQINKKEIKKYANL